MDVWSEKYVKMLEIGGNEPLNQFFVKYNLQELDITSRYKTIAMMYYRAKVSLIKNFFDLTLN